jgi:hypothetical protein
MLVEAFRKPPGNSINFEEGYGITFHNPEEGFRNILITKLQ